MFQSKGGFMINDINDYEEKIINLQGIFEKIIILVTNDYQKLELYKAEENIFRELLKMGLSCMELLISKKGTGKNNYSGNLPYHRTEAWKYISIFGDLKIDRAYFWKEGAGHGEYPLDAELNLPEEHFSYLLQKWFEMKSVDNSFDKSRIDIKEIFGIDIWSKQMEIINRRASKEVDNYYKEKSIVPQEEEILCIEADGKGIVIVDKDKQKGKRTRLKRGEKRNTKRMAVVTSIFGIDRNIREVEDIISIESKRADNKSKIENKANNKLIRGTLR